MTNQEECQTFENKNEQEQNNRGTFEKWIAFILIKGSNQSKHVSLLYGFLSLFSLVYDQYPNTITTATDILLNNSLEPKLYENKRDKCAREKASNDTGENKNIPTIFCNKYAT